MLKLVLATKNKDKVKEIMAILGDLPVEIKSQNDYPHIHDIVEDGNTYEDNALKKASIFNNITGLTSIADDSGLEVDALNGAPGIFAARYAGDGVTYRDNYEKLLRELEGLPFPERKARFVCIIAIVTVEHKVYFSRGYLEGYIIDEPRGSQGFGYDPVFYLPEYGRTVAELDSELKNRISHRAKALLKAKEIITENILGKTV
ncbi:XTP/dITP diphosphatase [bacterium]|nr:XTP/dITP diphosphatase [bacterium]